MSLIKLAGLMPVHNVTDLSGWDALRQMADFTIVLDDNSTLPFPAEMQADEVIRLRRGGLWNDMANRTMLLYRAYVNGFQWTISWEWDLLPSAKLFSGAKGLIDPSADCIVVKCRELWGDIRHYRTDGLWGAKQYTLLVRNWFFDERVSVPLAEVRLHHSYLSACREVELCMADPEYCVYHLGCLTPERRAARVKKYSEVDPRNEFQSDYSYLAAEDGATLAEVPEADAKLLLQLTHP